MDSVANTGVAPGPPGETSHDKPPDRDIGRWLVAAGALDEATLGRVRALQSSSSERLDVLLLELGLVAESDVVEAVAHFHDIDIATADQLASSHWSAVALNPAFLAAAEVALVEVDEELVRLAMVDPGDSEVVRAIEVATRRAVQPMAAAPSAIRAAASRLIASTAPADGPVTNPAADARQLEDLATGAPAVRLLNSVFARAVRLGATDIHLQPEASELRVRYRVDGALTDGERVSNDHAAALTSRAKVLGGMDIAERRLPQDGRLSIGIEGRALDVRVATMPTANGEGVVLRLLDRERAPIDLEGLGFAADTRRTLTGLLDDPHGVLLVTGPTGSGKSTTLQAAMRLLNCGNTKLVSIEDPVEYRIDGIDQVSVRAAHGLGFADALRATLRYDPDVIMLGEMRDAQTAEIAVQAALTGHKVLSTLHTNDAPGAITRLVDLGIPAFLISSTLQAVLAQRLVRTLCPECARRTGAQLRLPDGWCPPKSSPDWREPVGCVHCQGTGYRGRLVVHELLVVDEPLRDALRTSAEAPLLRRVARRSGMTPLLHDGLNKAYAGLTTVAEVLRVAKPGDVLGSGAV